MPQALGAMGIKAVLKRILNTLGYRGVLISNTIIVGILMMVFATIGLRTPIWVIVFWPLLWGVFIAAIHQHEHAGLRRHH
jgi:hypothetical protein